ncbi:hypothetical protein, partial [Anaerosporobacter sp.]
MKKKLLIGLVCILLITNTCMCAYIVKDKILNQHNTEDNKIKNEVNNNYTKPYFMMNPIDKYFIEKFSNYKNQVEYKIYQEAYLDIWKTEYNTIIEIIQKKCIYKEDIDIFNNFNDKMIETSFDKIEPALLAVMLDNFSIPESAEKHSEGVGNVYALKMYKGMLYRNACMLFVEYLGDNYKFPNSNQIEDSI